MKPCDPESGPEVAGIPYPGHETLQQGNKPDAERYLPFHAVSSGQPAGKRLRAVRTGRGDMPYRRFGGTGRRLKKDSL